MKVVLPIEVNKQPAMRNIMTYQCLVPPVTPVHQERHHVNSFQGVGEVLLGRLLGFINNGRFIEGKDVFKWCEGHSGKEIRGDECGGGMRSKENGGQMVDLAVSWTCPHFRISNSVRNQIM